VGPGRGRSETGSGVDAEVFSSWSDLEQACERYAFISEPIRLSQLPPWDSARFIPAPRPGSHLLISDYATRSRGGGKRASETWRRPLTCRCVRGWMTVSCPCAGGCGACLWPFPARHHGGAGMIFAMAAGVPRDPWAGGAPAPGPACGGAAWRVRAPCLAVAFTPWPRPPPPSQGRTPARPAAAPCAPGPRPPRRCAGPASGSLARAAGASAPPDRRRRRGGSSGSGGGGAPRAGRWPTAQRRRRRGWTARTWMT
jgi:hypothetical protein